MKSCSTNLIATFLSLAQIASLNAELTHPSFPLQFSTDVLITAHQIQSNITYPPHQQKFSIQYDFVSKRCSAIMNEGYNAGKTFIRRYDEKNEYMVKSGEFQDCQRAYLGESMPNPEFPQNFKYMGEHKLEHSDVIARHWRQVTETTQMELYMSTTEPSVPIQLTEFSLWSYLMDETSVAAAPLPLRTTQWFNTKLGPPTFHDDLPGGYSHQECKRNVAGFPYIHAFHHFLRF